MLKLGNTRINIPYSRMYLNNNIVYDGYSSVKTTPNDNNYSLINSVNGKNKGNIKIGDGPELEQFITTGKNKFDGNLENGSIDPTNGRPYSTNTRLMSTSFITVENTTYTFSVKNNANYNIVVDVYDLEGNFKASESQTLWTTLPFTKNFNSNRKFRFLLRFPNNATITTTDVDEIQVEFGDTATTYEPYYISPNPDYPQDIIVIEGSSNVEVSNKNLFNPTIAIEEQVNVDNTIQTSNLYTINNNSILCSRNTFNLGRLFFKGIKCKAGTYYIKAHVKITNSSYNDISYSIRNLNTMTDILRLQTATYETGEGDLAFSFTINEDVNEVGLSLQTNHTGTIEITKLMFSMSNDNYISHQDQSYPITLPTGMFLGNIPDNNPTSSDYKGGSNYIYGTKDNWTLHSGLIKQIIDGSQDWYKNADSPDGNYISFFRYDFWKNKKAKCNMFTWNSWNIVNNSNGNFMWSATSSGGFRIHKDYLTGYDASLTNNEKIALFKTWLSENEPEVIYPITPTETQITDATLITQLNNIADNLQTYKGETIVFTTSDNLEPNIQFDYRAI